MSTEAKSHQELVEKWGADNIPIGESLAFDEIVIPELGLKRCCSFRAQLTHKLNVICRSMPNQVWYEVARTLRVADSALRKWRAWTQAPGGILIWQRIDTAYEVALERLRLQAKQKADASQK